MDAYDNYGAANQLSEFADAVSNWYVRRSRERFWGSDKNDPEKLDAYWTLFECLTTVSKLTAPFVPFVSESIWKNLCNPFDTALQSVHLTDYPSTNPGLIDETLSQQMNLLREIASSGRSARANSKLKVRQPLSGVTVVLNDDSHRKWLQQHDDILKTELNVKAVNYTSDAGDYVTYKIIPNFKRVGPRVGKLMPQVKAALGTASGADLLSDLESNGNVTLNIEGQTVELDSDDIEVRLSANEGWAAAQGKSAVVILSTELTPDLIREGLARDVNRLVQDRRKELNLEFTDRIQLGLVTDDDELKKAVADNAQYIQQETLAVEFGFGPIDDVESAEREVGDAILIIYIKVV